MLLEINEETYVTIKPNDLVQCVTTHKGFPQKGWKGKILEKIKEYDLGLAIEWEMPFEMGHSCKSMGRNKHCRYYGCEEGHINQTLLKNIRLIKPEQLEFEF